MKKIVLIGGGGGTSFVCSAIRETNLSKNLSVLITGFDDGKSTGILRKEFGVPPLGDLRRCLAALSKNKELNEIFNYRFPKKSSLDGHALGNLILLALTLKLKDADRAIEGAHKILSVKGVCHLISYSDAKLCAKTRKNKIIRGEANIDKLKHLEDIEKLYLSKRAEPNKKALEAIENADVILLGPGDLHTSIAPHLLVERASDALRKSKAKKIFITNTNTKVSNSYAIKFLLNLLHMKKFDSIISKNKNVNGKYGKIVLVKTNDEVYDKKDLARKLVFIANN